MDDAAPTSFPSPHELQQIFPATEAQRWFIAKSRDTIKQILNGTDSRLLLILGPCSIHDRIAALEYASRLKELAATVADTFFITMRFYAEKSRTSLGWKGLLYDPSLDGTHNIEEGLRTARELLLELASMEMPTAAELLDPLSMPYYSDLLSWSCIGARTVESQPHRLMASGLPMAVSFKNSTAGNINAAANGVLVASKPHSFIGLNSEGRVDVVHTLGNPDSHITLRGGESGTNYDPASIQYALDCLKTLNLPQRVLIDCSHGNSRRNDANQAVVFKSVLSQIIEGNALIRGLALESHLNRGNQQLEAAPLRYAVSITDACLGWEATNNLILEGRRALRQAQAVPCISGRTL